MRRLWILCALCLLALVGMVLLGRAPAAQAAGIVGQGSPGTCTELQFDAALEGGGQVTFNCGPAPFTLTVHQKVISGSTTIDGGGLITLSGNDLNRVFSVTVGGGLYLNNLHVTHGYSSDLLSGGAIYNAGNLVLKNTLIDHSQCDSACAGAAILNTGTVALYDSTLSQNQMQIGGALTNLGSGSALILSSTLSLNSSSNPLSSGGAGFANRSNAISIMRASSVVSNSSLSDGGGILNGNLATLLVVNSTVSGNTADGNAGGLKNEGSMWLYNATVTNNYSDYNYDGTGTGGGIFNTNDFQFRNTILAANWESFFSNSFGWLAHNGECAGTLTSIGNNLMENYNTSHCTINGPFTLTAPLLGPLQFNGGATLNHLPLPTSPALNGGNASGCVDNAAETLTLDQRGFLRFGICDIGAVERSFRLELPLAQR